MRLRHATLFLALALAACGGSPPPPVAYRPLDYSYLPPIMLTVSSITVVDDYVPDPEAATLIGQAPEPPATALSDMLNRRLVANGTPGTATATIESAALNEAGGNLTGTMTVRLDVQSADGHRSGYTEASVTHSTPAPDPDADQPAVQAALYGMTKQLMDSMNVQLQYQIQQNLGSWVSYNANAAVAPLSAPANASGIQAVPLQAPGTPPGMTAPPPPSSAAPGPAPVAAPGLLPPGEHSLVPPGYSGLPAP